MRSTCAPRCCDAMQNYPAAVCPCSTSPCSVRVGLVMMAMLFGHALGQTAGVPTAAPTHAPHSTASPASLAPSSGQPTSAVTVSTTATPTWMPTVMPTAAPTAAPTQRPTTHAPTTSTTVTTTTTTSTTTLTCDPVYVCLADPACSSCLNKTQPFALPDHATDINASQSNALTLSGIAQMERKYFETLTSTPSCSSSPLFSASMNAIIVKAPDYFGEGGGCGYRFGACQLNIFKCFSFGPPCTTCLQAVLDATDARTALNSAACNSTRALNLTGLVEGRFTFPYDFPAKNVWEYDMAIGCAMYPACSVLKEERYCSGPCAQALTLIHAGNVSGAVRLCSETNVTCYQLDQIVKACVGNTDLSYAYFAARCSSMPGCGPCLSAMGNLTMGHITIAQGIYSDGCIPFPWNAADVLQNLVEQSPFSIVSQCSKSAFRCALNSGSCRLCLQGLVPQNSTFYPRCQPLLAEYGITEQCAPCPASLTRLNNMVIATAVVGGLSLALCLTVVVLIVAYSKDQYSLRNRILLNLMVANAVYSSANAIPFSIYSTSIESCGELVMSFGTIRFGRAWWLGGKYSMVFLELFILGWSTFALTFGEKHLPWRWEFALHTACVLGGLAAFVGFYVRVGQIERDGYNAATQSQVHSDSYTHLNADDDANDVSPAAAASRTWTAAHTEYNTVLQTMLRVWDAFLVVAIVVWLYLRRLFARLLAAWRVRLSEAEAVWNRDLWAPHQQGERATKLRFLTISKETYEELARPLEPFVFVFILFGIPATVMATDYCTNNSHSKGTADQDTVSNGAIECVAPPPFAHSDMIVNTAFCCAHSLLYSSKCECNTRCEQ
jgi:hypothetical protein